MTKKSAKDKFELLAPAGNLDKMKTAFSYGADAVYLGIPDFSLRVRINDFNINSLKEGIAHAKKLKKKVYITINIFAHNRHVKDLPKYLKILKPLSIDGLIISDPGILLVVKKYLPKIPVHLSTQANCTNLEAVKFWQKMGVERIILGREVTLKEISEIHKAVPKMELEYFIHGAMCMAYSGRCFLSKEILGRSGNLGDCAQPCRWEYETFIKARGHAEEFEIIHEKHGSYLLNSKDLCLIEYLEKLKKAGIISFKIEGRAKSVYYLANLVAIYRAALDHPKRVRELKKELDEKLIHRGYTTGFLVGKKGEQNINDAHNRVDWEFCGQVLQSNKKEILVKVHNTMKVGDDLEIILPGYDIIKTRIKTLIDFKKKASVSEAHGGGGGQKVIIPNDFGKIIPELTVIRRQIN